MSDEDFTVKISLEFQESEWKNVDRLLQYLEKNPEGYAFTVRIDGEFEV